MKITSDLYEATATYCTSDLSGFFLFVSPFDLQLNAEFQICTNKFKIAKKNCRDPHFDLNPSAALYSRDPLRVVQGRSKLSTSCSVPFPAF